MKTCKNCGAALTDDILYCTSCGAKAEETFTENAQAPNPADATANGAAENGAPNGTNPGFQNGVPGANVPPYYYMDASDHTAEFSAEDIHKNKIFAMICYILGIVGIIVAKLAAPDSAYVQFHVRQALKFTVCQFLLTIIMFVLLFTIIVPLAAGICMMVLGVLEIICFVDVCNNKAKDAPIIKSFKFFD